MNIHVCTPFSREKNLGRAYNEAFARCPENDWLCLIDHDVMFLTPDAIKIMHEYIEAFPHAGLFTAFTNRIHQLAVNQLFLGSPSNDFDVKNWAYRAKMQAKTALKVTEIKHPISGFLMLVSKRTWNEIKFMEIGECLGVDNYFSNAILKAGKQIYRMDRIIVWHSYRLENILDKSHLR